MYKITVFGDRDNQTLMLPPRYLRSIPSKITEGDSERERADTTDREMLSQTEGLGRLVGKVVLELSLEEEKRQGESLEERKGHGNKDIPSKWTNLKQRH